MGKQTEDAGFSGGQHQQTAANESPEKPSTPDTTIEMTDVDKQSAGIVLPQSIEPYGKESYGGD